MAKNFSILYKIGVTLTLLFDIKFEFNKLEIDQLSLHDMNRVENIQSESIKDAIAIFS